MKKAIKSRRQKVFTYPSKKEYFNWSGNFELKNITINNKLYGSGKFELLETWYKQMTKEKEQESRTAALVSVLESTLV